MDQNIAHFVRVLRRAGLRIGPAATLDCIEASRTIDIGNRVEFYHALASCCMKNPEDRLVFDQAFQMFWRNPRLMEKMRDLLLPSLTREVDGDGEEDPNLRRVDEAFGSAAEPDPQQDERESIEIDMSMTSSATELLQTTDFQMMSTAEIAEAERAIDAMRLAFPTRPSRRFSPASSHGRLSFRRTLRRMARQAGMPLPAHEKRQQRARPIVVICDISGSMERYSRMLLRFAHALTQRRGTVHSFLFGTRLTNVTRQMKDRDPDAALRAVSASVEDWSGGTRISSALQSFNRNWSRRVLGQGAVVLLITDGLDRDEGGDLGFEIDRLHRSCARLVWLNPLLRFDGFEPRSGGVQTILPHVDAFLPVHSLESIRQLSDLLQRDMAPGWRSQTLASWHHRLHDIQAEQTAGGGIG
ncbi:MAG TPA: VWA domain-containing protein [Alphaproteobacteria bacterium]|nr:MAG: VWA domain-containing protein [SAR116 cluster bacterium MED-G06]HCV88088.1 VWA domain-containing protein [Alphaproteobacteria bacterium]|tara:strand:+ start:7436 stop:8674 length:1239 start_codon:yes stop_codon:yes gene_type:complete